MVKSVTKARDGGKISMLRNEQLESERGRQVKVVRNDEEKAESREKGVRTNTQSDRGRLGISNYLK